MCLLASPRPVRLKNGTFVQYRRSISYARLGSRWKMCSKQAANEITDLDGSKGRQQLQRHNDRVTATPNADGENDCGRQYEQHEGDCVKT